MRKKTFLTALLTGVLCGSVFGGTDSTSSTTPVLVELFTSEGCSSCPPADKMLANLDRLQPVAGAQAIVIEEHVDYWNHDGWMDKYSSSAFTERQSVYKDRFKLNDDYTPQMVVDGETQFNGSDAKAAVKAIEEARGKPKVGVRLSAFSVEGKAAHVHVEADGLTSAIGAGKADVYVVIALDRAESQVLRGENKGRDLKHVAVALAVNKVGTVNQGEAFRRDVAVKLPSSVEAANLRVIAFVQKGDSGEVIGSALLAANGANAEAVLKGE
ncbi:MAG TPA: DUF1223 domain-containing protein [Terriglobales bacterium]|nr:DUF1223 domain-containing protein [Terriglobales bacterium]